VRLNRRHRNSLAACERIPTKGQRAMAVATIYPDPEKGGRAKVSKAGKAAETAGFSARRILPRNAEVYQWIALTRPAWFSRSRLTSLTAC
jgi:hypothetical protein